jgi:hypothetical protein
MIDSDKMASSHQDIDNTQPSQVSTASRLASSEATPSPFRFETFFRSTYPDKGILGPSGKRKTTGRVVYECLHCPGHQPWRNAKRDNAIHHARRCHAEQINGREITTIGDESDIYTLDTERKRPRLDAYFPSRPSDSSLRRIFDRQRYIHAMVSLFARRRVAFSSVEWDELQELMLAANPAIDDLLLSSRSAVMRHITVTFDLYRSQLKTMLERSVSKIHISSDLWTSPHRHGVLAICARWVDDGYQPRKALLAMPECRYSHSGERQASLIMSALEGYGIARRLGYHTGDNATSNDTCLAHLSTMLEREYNISFDPKQHRIRCIAHIINLSLQAFLLASSKEALLAALEATIDMPGDQLFTQFYDALRDTGSEGTDQTRWRLKRDRRPPGLAGRTLENFNGWQQIGPLRKVHNIAVWLRSSTLHSDIWDERVMLRLGIDNATRWNSWYNLLDHLLAKQQLVKQFLLDHDQLIGDNILSASDWHFIEKSHKFLQPFASATLWAEGSHSTLSQTLSIMDILLRQYEKHKDICTSEEGSDPYMLHCIEMGWFVLDKYYTLSGDTPAYAAALLLDPSKRSKYIERNWDKSWHAPAIDGARGIWEEEYNTTAPSTSIGVGASGDIPASSHRVTNELAKLQMEISVIDELSSDADSFDAFISAAPIKIEGSPLKWWCHEDQRRAYPRLSRMAIDILSIAPESSDAESVFSSGRRTLTWDRHRLKCTNLEKVECVGNWLREGIIEPSSRGGMGIIVPTGIDYGMDANLDGELD